MVLIHFKLNPITQGCFVLSFVLEKMIIKVCQYIFAIFSLSPLRKAHGPSFEQIWFPFTQGCFVQSLVVIGPVVLNKKFLKFFNVSLLFLYYPPFKKGRVLHQNKVESPSPKNALCQVWLKLTHWFLRTRFFKVRQCIFAISLLPPLEKGLALHLNKFESPSPRGALCQVWLK